MTIPACGRGTFRGAAADASKYGFAPCILSQDHGGEHDSGPCEAPELGLTDITPRFRRDDKDAA
jgi:hypothetical protein